MRHDMAWHIAMVRELAMLACFISLKESNRGGRRCELGRGEAGLGPSVPGRILLQTLHDTGLRSFYLMLRVGFAHETRVRAMASVMG